MVPPGQSALQKLKGQGPFEETINVANIIDSIPYRHRVYYLC